jgi:hypothetical protein
MINPATPKSTGSRQKMIRIHQCEETWRKCIIHWALFGSPPALPFVWFKRQRSGQHIYSVIGCNVIECNAKTARLSLWLQRHKSVTEKSQACGCKVTKRRVIMQQINYSTRMIVVCVEPAETLWENLCDQSQGAAVLWEKRAMSSMGGRVGDSKGLSVSMRSRKFSQHDYLLKTN